MAQGLEASHLETTCCVCAGTDVPRKDRRKVSEALALTALGLKVNEISQISLKLPGNAIIRVCKHCSDQLAKVERLETEMAATRSRIDSSSINTLSTGSEGSGHCHPLSEVLGSLQPARR